MKNYDAYIFDFDYTLADATNPIVESFNYAFDKMEIERASYKDIVNTIGIPLGEAFTLLTGDESEESIELFKKYQKERSDEITVAQTVFIGNAKQVLEKIKSDGKKIGIVSSRWGQRINDILVNLDARELVDSIIGTEHVDRYKPDPQGIFMTMEKFNSKNILYVGDSHIDAEAAQNAGVDFAGVTTGTTSREKLESYPYVGVFDELEKILEI